MRAPIGIVPIIFANDDLPELTPLIEPETLVAEIALLGFAGLSTLAGPPAGCRAPARAAAARAAHRRSLRRVAVHLRWSTSEARGQAFEQLDALRRS